MPDECQKPFKAADLPSRPGSDGPRDEEAADCGPKLSWRVGGQRWSGGGGGYMATNNRMHRCLGCRGSWQIPMSLVWHSIMSIERLPGPDFGGNSTNAAHPKIFKKLNARNGIIRNPENLGGPRKAERLYGPNSKRGVKLGIIKNTIL